ncbi:MAG: oligosaccharide flippase family protein [Thermoanaerobaculia bacterium]|nr:oligosaccharide flippase family protein [Thermoanaerobaculia bacterium]
MRVPKTARTTEKRFLFSAAASYGSQLGRTVLRLAADLALARLILPDDHGLFDLAWPIVLLAGFFRDLGLPYELVRHERQPYGSFLIWELGAGILVAGALALGAPLLGGMSPGLPEVLPVLAIFVVLDGLAVVPRIFFERQLAVNRLLGPEIGRGVVLAAVSIGLALLDFGVWSFVVGELVAMAVYALVLWRRAWGAIPLELDFGMVPRLLRHSALLFLIALLANAVALVGRFLVKSVADTAMVAQFSKAMLWSLRTQILILPALLRALYPALVAYRSDRHRFLTAYRLGTVAVLSVEILVAYFLFFNAEVVIVELLLGPNWGPAAELVRILCLLPLVDVFNLLGGEMLKVRREDRVWLVIVTVNLLCLGGFGWLLAGRHGVEGVAWAHYLMLGNLLMAWRVGRICGPEFPRLLADLLYVIAVPLPLYLVAAWLFPPASWARFAASLAAAALAAGLLGLRFHRPFRRFFRDPPVAG